MKLNGLNGQMLNGKVNGFLLLRTSFHIPTIKSVSLHTINKINIQLVLCQKFITFPSFMGFVGKVEI